MLGFSETYKDLDFPLELEIKDFCSSGHLSHSVKTICFCYLHLPQQACLFESARRISVWAPTSLAEPKEPKAP